MTGFCFNPTHWGVGWTAGYTNWESIYWIGPLGLMFRKRVQI